MSSNPVSDATSAVREGVSAVSEVVKLAKENEHAREAGDAMAKSLSVVSNAVYNLLLPFRWLNIYGMRAQRYIDERFAEELGQRVDAIPEEERVEPKPHVVGSIMQGIFETVDEDELRSLYLNLLAASMDGRVSSKVHPAYAEIIKQLSPAELPGLVAMIGGNLAAYPLVDLRMVGDHTSWTLLRYITEANTHPVPTYSQEAADLASSWIENWRRLGLVDPEFDAYWSPQHFDWVRVRPEFAYAEQVARSMGERVEIRGGMLRVTSFGFAFASAIGARTS